MNESNKIKKNSPQRKYFSGAGQLAAGNTDKKLDAEALKTNPKQEWLRLRQQE